MFRIAVVSLALVALAGCQPGSGGDRPDPPQPGVLYAPVPVAGEVATPSERAACEAVGGMIQPAGLLGWENCIQSFPDGGQTCSDAADCIGRCMNTGEFVDGPAVGQCEFNDNPFGCHQEIIGGIAQAALCVD